MNISANISSTSYMLIEEGKDDLRQFLKFRVVNENDEPMTMEQWATAVASAESDKDPAIFLLNKAIAESPFSAVFFETPPVVPFSTQPFEFVVVDAPKLHEFATDNPDESTFRVPLRTAEITTHYGSVFYNLGKDALLIVPKPMPSQQQSSSSSPLSCYAHLATFIRNAPPLQVAAVWKMVATALLDRLAATGTPAATSVGAPPQSVAAAAVVAVPPPSDQAPPPPLAAPVWLSTSGLGIYWLHFRLDTVPKYYTYAPYKRPDYTVASAAAV
jgi:hypothetical protein